MKRAIILLLLCLTVGSERVWAQASVGRELPRTRTISYPSQELARAASTAPSRYLQPLDNWTQQGGTWTTTFKMPFEWVDRKPFLHISAADSPYTITVNDKSVGRNNSAATAAEFDLTDIVKEGVNTLIINVSSEDILSSGGEGLGEVYITAQPRVRMRDYTVNLLPEAVELGVIVKSHLLNPKTVRVYYSFTAPDGTPGPYGHRDADFEMKLEDTVRFYVPLPKPRAWSHEMPYLYTLDLKLQHEGRFTEYVSHRIGLRTIALKDSKLVVNGRPVTLTAENTLHLRHPASDSVYRAADSLGLYVIGTADIATSRWGKSRARGGNPSNDPRWENDYVDRLLSMYYTSQTHPSAAVFALADDSANGYNLYESYLALKAVEPLRPVVYFGGGEWNSDTLTIDSPSASESCIEVDFVRDTVWMDGKRESRGAIYRLTSRFETASMHDLTVEWEQGRTHGNTILGGVLKAGETREFMVEYGKNGRADGTLFNIYRPAEHFDPPAIIDKRRLVLLGSMTFRSLF